MGGPFDSSRTRVAPVFEALSGWVERLLRLPQYGSPDARSYAGLDLSPSIVDYGKRERRLPAPPALLEWLLHNVAHRELDDSISEDSRRRRAALFRRDPATLSTALQLVSEGQITRGWHVFEGPTAPDVYIETRDAIIVVEGKRTEAGPTVDTEWMPGRHQMWRHIDAAWEMRGQREVFGFFIVEGDRGGRVPDLWRLAAEKTWAEESLNTSFPHRTRAEQAQLRQCFLGVTTWQAVVREFGLPDSVLPATTTDIKG